MKILATGDIHGDKDLVRRLADRAERENVDLVVLCGDLTHFEKDTSYIVGPFVKKNKKVILVPGNHETVATVDFLAELYGAVNMHGYSIKYKNVGFFGCGGANTGLFCIEEKEIFRLLKKGFEGIKDIKKKVMITHIHPSETLIEKFSSFVRGSSSVRKAIDEFKPDILLCAHVHEADGIEEKIGKTRVIDVGKEGTIIEI